MWWVKDTKQKAIGLAVMIEYMAICSLYYKKLLFFDTFLQKQVSL